MNWFSFVIVATGALAVADARPEAPREEDRDRIQGAWVLVSTERDGETVPSDSVKGRDVRMVFDGDRVVAKAGDMSVGLGTFALDPSKSPKTYDRTYPDGSPRRGIYKLEGDTLTICVAGLGKARPSGFSTKSGDGASLVVYKRE